MAGSGSSGKMLAMGILLAMVVVGLAVADRQTDHFTKVKAWAGSYCRTRKNVDHDAVVLS
jgi:hypothetical protein